MRPLTDIQLYDFLKENNDSIIKDMTNVQISHEGRSMDVSKEIPIITTKTITSRLLDSSHFFESHLNEWLAVVKSNLYLNFSVSYLADLLTNYRQIYSRYIEQFILSQETSIKPELACHWLRVINEGFDRLFSLFIDQMDKAKNTQLSKQQNLINEISTTVIPLIRNIGILPLTGQMDANRFEFILSAVPRQCISLDVNRLFIDMSGVPLMDAFIAEQLSKLTKMLSMLGISVTISGMKPEVALYTVQSGIDLSQFSTASTLKQALRNSGISLTAI